MGDLMDRKARLAHFDAKLALETDPSDLKKALDAGEDVVVVDARSPESYAREHIPGAVNIPHRTMSKATTARLPKKATIVAYCDGIGCNASTKGARNLTALGFQAKELVGGIEWWKKDGFKTAKGRR